ncbi:MAG: hypothetical protein LBM64_10040 [Deltaproteobacteria bacterium]|nr:hypothetical protein [Deltaproteobacteria bacterium]
MRENDNNFLAWLEFCAEKVNALEAEARKRQSEDADEAYKEALLDKAAFIASLAREGQTYLVGLAGELREFAKKNLGAFSENADWALKLKSYANMSALLYSDEHQPGAPNLLSLFLEEMRGRLK